ncbi:MAG: L,D-transpeptidase family protein [Lachnospiraceae bacterium]|nr:L,D-transpeptidase family protein [Lachnospiraceae bacterium]
MKKTIKRCMASILSATLALSLAASTPATTEAASVKLSKKKMTISVGESKTLKVKNTSKKVTWKIKSGSGKIKLKNKKKNSVKIVAKKAGKAVVIAKVGKKKLKCKITVKEVTATSTPATTAAVTKAAATKAAVTPVPTAVPTAVPTVAPTEVPATSSAVGYGDLYAATQEVVDSPEWVQNLDAAKDENVKQLFVVGALGMDKTTATVSMNERDENGNWKQVLSSTAYVGKNGLCADADHKEGCGQTPIGTYTFNRAFGIADDPGCAIDYVKVDNDTYWSGDQREGMRYNELVDIKDYPDLDTANSEHIVDYAYQYRYCLNISFNDECAAGRGSAIFLHCLGSVKPYTGGCVAVPEYIMKQIMQKVSPDCVVVIDTLDNMGATL